MTHAANPQPRLADLQQIGQDAQRMMGVPYDKLIIQTWMHTFPSTSGPRGGLAGCMMTDFIVYGLTEEMSPDEIAACKRPRRMQYCAGVWAEWMGITRGWDTSVKQLTPDIIAIMREFFEDFRRCGGVLDAETCPALHDKLEAYLKREYDVHAISLCNIYRPFGPDDNLKNPALNYRAFSTIMFRVGYIEKPHPYIIRPTVYDCMYFHIPTELLPLLKTGLGV